MQPQLIAGRYQVLRAIGRGGMGTVWLCRDDVLGREVAVKQMGAVSGESATETKRAMREARSAAAFNHPNAVAVYDVVNHNERPWLVMEYVEGQTLADEISRDGQLSPRRVADIGPAAGKGPPAASPFAHEQELLAAEDDRPHVHLRGRVAEARGEGHADLLGRDAERALRHRHRDLAQLLVALAVERIARVGEPRLRDRLDPLRPAKPVGATVAARAHFEAALGDTSPWRASSSSITCANASNGWAPTSGRPLTKNAGVPETP